MGNVCCCEFDASKVSLAELKSRLEGDTKLVNTVPEVRVTIDELMLQDGGAFKFTPNKFTLNGLHFRTTVTIKGTPAEIATLVATDASGKAMDKIGVNKEHKVRSMLGGLASKVTNLAGQASAKVGMSDTRSIKVESVVNMVKHFGDEQVQVSLQSFNTDVAVFNSILSVEKARQFIEKAISEKASEVATRLAKKEYDGKMAKLGLGATSTPSS
mmetsp:Transcript_71777/g.171501  ORF Transcript_71777/g.171501 Transcript_71777/m.171501 type:complete len:214 (+) Transcript_71777:101-742(+)